MSKEDAPPLPDAVPKKRRHIENILDVHLAMWLAGDITPLERKKLTTERERRRSLRPDVKMGVIMGSEGMTPEQFRTFQRVTAGMGATEVHHPTVPGKVYRVLKELDVPLVRHGDLELYDPRVMLRDCTVVVAAPRESRPQTQATPGVWAMIGYAKHRSLPVRVILPDGKEVT